MHLSNRISVLADCRPAVAPVKSGIGHFAQAVVDCQHFSRHQFHTFTSLGASSIQPALALATHIERSSCDVFFSPLFVVPPIRVANMVVCLHDPFPLSHPDLCTDVFHALWNTHLPPALRAACLVVTVSEWSKRRIIDTLHLPHDRIQIVRQGIAPAFSPAPVDPGVLERYGLRGKSYVLAIGDMSERKNLRRLRAAMATPALRKVVLAIAGPGSESMARENGVLPLGYVPDEDLPPLIRGARCLVFPSLAEGFGRPCIEAMACGTPVVASSATAIPETCGDAALLPNPELVSEIAAAIDRACHDEPMRQRLITAGLERARGYTAQIFANDLDAACEAAMATGGTPIWDENTTPVPA